ncbi:hypothetical protein AB0F52_15110 [Amycolatopsis sp. NPDC024027]|uniref:hypothetical protein n=1 Tax=Amycolatopsis sp. NPDC024027 TaxID=3154327 RepID=UPI0033E26EDD
MTDAESLDGLRGRYRDIVLDAAGRVVLDRGWRSNAIAASCRALLAAMLRGSPPTSGLVGMQVGAGLPAWDSTGPPLATSAQTTLVDPHPFTVGPTAMKLDFLAGNAVSVAPTNRLQIQATLGPNLPAWPDAGHASASLREFGLIATLAGGTVLINYVTHLVIAKDPASTLQRTIWLTF